MSFDEFKNADAGEPPDGIHHATLESANVFESQKGDTFVKLTWRTQDLEHYWESLHGTQGRAKHFTQEAVTALGIDFGNLKDWQQLDTELRAREGSVYEVRVERNGSYLNSYVEGRPQGVQGTLPDVPIDTTDFETAPAAANGSDDDIPF